MSKKLSFEDAFNNKMNDLPTGDEDKSWQKMKQLLEEKEKRKPFVWFNIYTICTSIVIIAGFCIWMMYHRNINSSIQKEITTADGNHTKGKTNIHDNQKKANQLSPEEQPDSIEKNNNKTDSTLKQVNVAVAELKPGTNEISSLNKNETLQTKNYKNTQLNMQQTAILREDSNNLILKNNINKTASANFQDLNNYILSKSNRSDSITSSSLPAGGKYDSAKMQTDIANKVKPFLNFDSVAGEKQIKISFKPQTKFFVEAGIQLKQQIPLSGQKITAYSYSGNKELLEDYIPSVFIRVGKSKQWFLQGEFSYTTPQLVKQFLYSRQTKADYIFSTVTVTTASLRKIYYDELPVSFNYYVHPRWSIGAGVIHSWFRGAVAEQETTINNIKEGSYNTTKQIMPFRNFTDSFLYKNQTSLLFQTGYSLKKWTFTLRYEQGIQPYIKYTLPGGAIRSRKNSSVELNIGYRFIKMPF